MYRLLMSACIAGILSMGATTTLAQHGEQKTDTTAKAMCPISGHPLDFFAHAATDEGPVYFCCAKCIGEYEKDKAKYADAVAAQRTALAGMDKVQVTCPVTNEPCDKKISLDADGQKVFFASEEAKSKYQAEPAKFKAALANSYTFQTKCPIMGKGIDPKRFVTLADGNKVYVCCGQCDKKVISSPEKIVDKLAKMGFVFDPASVKK